MPHKRQSLMWFLRKRNASSPEKMLMKLPHKRRCPAQVYTVRRLPGDNISQRVIMLFIPSTLPWHRAINTPRTMRLGYVDKLSARKPAATPARCMLQSVGWANTGRPNNDMEMSTLTGRVLRRRRTPRTSTVRFGHWQNTSKFGFLWNETFYFNFRQQKNYR